MISSLTNKTILLSIIANPFLVLCYDKLGLRHNHRLQAFQDHDVLHTHHINHPMQAYGVDNLPNISAF